MKWDWEMFGTCLTNEEKLARQLENKKEEVRHLNTVIDRVRALQTAITKALQDGDRETALQLSYLLGDIL